MRAWKDVATLVKTRSLNGRFVARAAAGLPFVLQEGQEVAFVPPQTDQPRYGVVTEVVERGDGSYEVTFDSVAEETTARGLVGCHCLVRRQQIADTVYEDPSAAWLGWTVALADGTVVGDVGDLVENPAHPLIEVDRPGSQAPAYIPAVEEFIVDVDVDGRVIVVDPPAGLLDL